MVKVELCRLEFAVIPTQHVLKQEVSTRQSSAFSPPHCRALPQPVPGPNPDSATATSTTRETTIGGKGKRMEINWNSVVYSQ